MVSVVLSIGSNLGDRYFYIREMEEALDMFLKGVEKSDLMETEPVGVGQQPWFLNRIISGNFEGTVQQLFAGTRRIEEMLGRENKGCKTSRTADIDILLFGEEVINTADIVIPHSQILFRRFCLEGMNQIVSDRFIPGTGRLVSEHYGMMSSDVRAQRIFFLHEKGSDCSDGRS